MKKWTRILPAAAAAAALFVGIGTMTARAQKNEDHTIADRIYIGEVSVGGMTAETAEEAVSDYIDGLSDQKVTLRVSDKKLKVKAEKLGLTWKNKDVVREAENFGKKGNLIARYKAGKDLEHEDKVFALSFEVDEEKTAQLLNARAKDLNRKAVDFGLERKDGEFRVTGGKDGIEINVEKSVEAIDQFFEEGWQEKPSIEIAADITKPQGSEEELKKVKDVLGAYHTNYASSAWGRKANIANGCGKINGSVIYPGEEFSVYGVVSPFSKDNGYELAGAFENGTTVDAYGGGICQVSTTLYNAVIRAELDITERSGHSMVVNYVDPSADAAIAGTYKDFKFKNNTKAPIYIDGYTTGSEIYFTVYGEETRPENRSVSFVSETLSTTPAQVKFQATGDPIGVITKTQSSHVGKSARLWKVITVDGAEQSREIFNKTSYKMSPTIYSVGTGSSNKEAVAAMKKAIASQDEKTIRAAAAKWNDKTLEAEKAKKEAEKKKEKEKNDSKEKDPASDTKKPSKTDASDKTDTSDKTNSASGSGKNSGADKTASQ